jgi:DNA-directed RNA polymerase specialized sigma24 family protein
MVTTLAVPCTPPPADPLRQSLADASILGRLHSMVRRTIPADAVRDVVHQVVCEALAAAEPPDDPDAVRPWLFGIARHKVADFHRARRAIAAGVDLEQLSAREAPLEARSLLRGILADASSDPRAVQTMDWMAREAEGERLDDLAREAALRPATVRQRVSRMRRWLRKRWAGEALLLAALSLVVLVMVRAEQRARRLSAPDAISSDPAGDSAAAARAALQGHWHVVSATPDGTVSSVLAAALAADALTASVDIDGDHLELKTATRHRTERIEVGPVASGAFDVRLVDPNEHANLATARLDRPDRLIVVGRLGEWLGTVILVR